MAMVVLSAFTGAEAWRRPTYHWVDTWATMPQLTEPANLPPAPYVSLAPSFCLFRINGLHFVESNWRRIRKLHNPPNTAYVNWRFTNPDSNFKRVWGE